MLFILLPGIVFTKNLWACEKICNCNNLAFPENKGLSALHPHLLGKIL